jgi:hypothetical protein
MYLSGQGYTQSNKLLLLVREKWADFSDFTQVLQQKGTASLEYILVLEDNQIFSLKMRINS